MQSLEPDLLSVFLPLRGGIYLFDIS